MPVSFIFNVCDAPISSHPNKKTMDLLRETGEASRFTGWYPPLALNSVEFLFHKFD